MSDKDIQINVKDVGAHLRSKRTALGLTQQAIADACDISLDTYKKWEQGNRLPPLLELVKLSRFYGCPMESLLLLDAPDNEPTAYKDVPDEEERQYEQFEKASAEEDTDVSCAGKSEENVEQSVNDESEAVQTLGQASDPMEKAAAKTRFPKHLAKTILLAGCGVVILIFVVWLAALLYFDYRIKNGNRNGLVEDADMELLPGNPLYFEDGSYITVELATDADAIPNGSIQAVKTITCYKNKDVLWSAELSASFLYSSYMSAGTAASFMVDIQNDKYILKDKAVSMVGNTAVATVTIIRMVLGITVSATTQVVTLSCDVNGIVS